ncbi:hypothetical protein AWB78_06979 [Caballeronia calidae]|uniref:Uncharacterized protein n=1 Tax=Caballeronia calidae TaxID=1777139 RepID=A0A158EDJ2_9BURK|nr:hypothetical protein AWB78_06979 [Caballeronia calidae]
MPVSYAATTKDSLDELQTTDANVLFDVIRNKLFS